MSEMTMEKARISITKAIVTDGPYSNNIVGSVLRSVAAEFGNETANDLIDEFDITELFDIEKVNP